MKNKVILGLLIALFVLNIVLVIAENNSSDNLKENINSNINKTHKINNLKKVLKEDIKKQLRKDIRQIIKKRLKEKRKNYMAKIRGKNVTFEKGEKDEIRLKVRNHIAKTKLNITEEIDENNETILVFKKNGITREIKIMPDTASERAIERLRLKVCSEENNCTIELKEVPIKKGAIALPIKTKIAYHIKAKKKFKVLGLFKKQADIEGDLDAETGEMIKIKKPWWAFLAFESKK